MTWQAAVKLLTSLRGATSKYPNVTADVQTLLSGGHLVAGGELASIVTDIALGDLGKIQELKEAATRAAAGHDVLLGPVTKDTFKAIGKEPVPMEADQRGKVAVGADVVDFSDKAAIQMKRVSGAAQINENISSALRQLDPARTPEVPPTGFKRVIDIRLAKPDPIPEGSPYGKSRDDLLAIIKPNLEMEIEGRQTPEGKPVRSADHITEILIQTLDENERITHTERFVRGVDFCVDSK
jgi:hypothetical protein